MPTKAGRAKIEDIKKGAKLFIVDGFTMSEEITKVFVTEPYCWEDARKGPTGDFFEWFMGRTIVGRKHTNDVTDYHFADYGIDTRLNKADYNAVPAYPEAMNFIFIAHWHALQYVRRLKRLYPDRIPGKSPPGSFEAQTKKEREDAKRDEDTAHDETFALAP